MGVQQFRQVIEVDVLDALGFVGDGQLDPVQVLAGCIAQGEGPSVLTPTEN